MRARTFASRLGCERAGGANHGVNLLSKVVPLFGTTRLDAWGGLQGVLCFDGVTPGGVTNIEVDFSSGLV